MGAGAGTTLPIVHFAQVFPRLSARSIEAT
jgi:hypothetical protein